ncbi:Ribosome production factor 1 [Malassezia yamatoensis]|uniref:Ribosome production factor 1 n=1 Tax=Malassezia yamatoensis TaxID=253288 RepID=A0AAJ6CGK5_9BASI|nr:Ribosome production factor 1 [Malassezia yamatoensis]
MRARASEAEEAPVRKSGDVSHIGNKHKRQDMYQKYRKEKARSKLQRRLQTAKDERTSAEGKRRRKERLAANKTKTIENSRSYNPTVLNAPNTHEVPSWMQPVSANSTQSEARTSTEQRDDDQTSDAEDSQEEDQTSSSGSDEHDRETEKLSDTDSMDNQPEEMNEIVDPHQAKYDQDADPTAPPAILITTSLPSNATSPHLASANARSHPAEEVRNFVKQLLSVFTGAEYRPRAKAKGAGLGKICSWARARRYDAVIVIGEARKKPCTLTLVQLPMGPTALFRLTSISYGKEIYGHARNTGHSPELIMNNFTTALGHRVGHMLQHLFPKVPELEGRQVVTAHNQRDYVFFRRHRYEFRSTEKAALQEIGPRFTLKLVSMAAGLPKGAGAWNGRFVDELEVDDSPPSQADEQQQQDLDDGIEFSWKPKMSASRRSFYL